MSQTVVVLLYFTTQSPPVIIYDGPMPSPAEIRIAQLQGGAMLVVLGVVIALLLTPVARWVVRR